MPREKRKTNVARTAKLLAESPTVRRGLKSKKKESSWTKALKGAASVALDVLPEILPGLLGAHQPTRMAAARAGQNIPDASMVGYANPTPPLVAGGLVDIKALKKEGRVTGTLVDTMDYLGDVSCAEGAAKGDLLLEIDLNPNSPDWAGTRLQAEASLYERYKPLKLVPMFYSAMNVTTSGQLLMYIDTDPADTPDNTGTNMIQVAATHDGAEMFQVWQMGMAGYTPDPNTEDFFADALGTDERLISPGKLRVYAASDIAATDAALGCIYILAQTRLSVSQIETDDRPGSCVEMWSTTGESNLLPLGTAPNVTNFGLGTVEYSGATGKIYGLPPGEYMMYCRLGGTGLGSCAMTDSAHVTILGSEGSYTGINDISTMLWFLEVPEYDAAYNANDVFVQWDNSEADTVDEAHTLLLMVPQGFFDAITPEVGKHLTRFPRRKQATLQDYERLTTDLLARIERLEAANSQGETVTAPVPDRRRVASAALPPAARSSPIRP